MGHHVDMVTALPRRTPQTARPGRRLLWITAALLAGAVCAVVVVTVGSIATVPGSGHPTTDVRVAWLLPAIRLVVDVSAAATVGCLTAAAFLLPVDDTGSLAGFRWLRCATWSAGAWAIAALAAAPGMLVEFLDAGLRDISVRAVISFLMEVPEGRAQAGVVLLAGLVAGTSRSVLTTAGARTLLLVSLLAAALPAATEHLGHDGSPAEIGVATVAMVLHVLGALAWSGALLALLLIRRLPAPDLATAVRRFSRYAPALAATVGASGLLSAFVELANPGQLLGTAYGRLVLLKALAFTGLIGLGWWHRRRTVLALCAGQSRAFHRAAAVELLVFAVTIGLAVGLSRTPAPGAAAETVHAAGGHPTSTELLPKLP